MVLTTDELLSALRSEVKILLHLADKVEPHMLAYRPAEGQRSLLELLQYLSFMGPIHARLVRQGCFTREAFGAAWTREETAAKARDLEAIKEAIAAQPGLYNELFANCTGDELRAQIQLFGPPASRGSLLVALVLNHYAAYRMQLFIYLKAAGRTELNTMNLWTGAGAPS